MRIGILTYHRAHNYGAMLQAVALRFFLEKQGHKVSYIDYWPDYHKNHYKKFPYSSSRNKGVRNKIKFLIFYFLTFKAQIKRYEGFHRFETEYISPYCVDYPNAEVFDLIVYGSDQIWRKQKHNGNQYNPIYFGSDGLFSKKRISYAASMGNHDVSNDDKVELTKLLSHLDTIGVREEELYRIVSGLGFQNIYHTIDPTLLLTASEWRQLVPSSTSRKNKYVLLYDIGKTFDRKEISRIAKNKDLTLVTISSTINPLFPNDFSTASPFDFLELFSNAEFIFTSSFHGLMFSLIFRKPFYASFRLNPDRAKSILGQIGLLDRFLEYGSRVPGDFGVVNYDAVTEKLDSIINESKKILIFQ